MAADFFDGLSETITRTAKELSERAEIIYETQKIRNRISTEERIMDKVFADLGNLIYKRYSSGEPMDEELSVLCEEVKQHEARINRYKDELAKRKGEKVCPDCGKSVSQEVSFCPYCGAPCPDMPKEEDEASQEQEQEPVEETAEEVQDEEVSNPQEPTDSTTKEQETDQEEVKNEE